MVGPPFFGALNLQGLKEGKTLVKRSPGLNGTPREALRRRVIILNKEGTLNGLAKP